MTCYRSHCLEGPGFWTLCPVLILLLQSGVRWHRLRLTFLLLPSLWLIPEGGHRPLSLPAIGASARAAFCPCCSRAESGPSVPEALSPPCL